MKRIKKDTSEQEQKTEQLIEQEESESNKSLESNVDTSFFYTSDKFINSFDNDEIIAKIQDKFTNLNDKNTDSIIKKSIVSFLDDEKFVEYILKHYNITIFELFKLLYKQYSSIFKGPYLKKLRKTISNKRYAKLDRRKTDY